METNKERTRSDKSLTQFNDRGSHILLVTNYHAQWEGTITNHISDLIYKYFVF